MLTRQFPFHFLLAAAACVASPLASAALPGALDTSFGGDGMVVTDFAPYASSAEAVLQQPDGKLVVAGYVNATNPGTDEKILMLVRYNASNGARDASFGTDGVRLVGFANGIRAAALARQPDGKLLVAGWVRTSGNDVLAVLRVNANGTLDTGFSGDGVATAAIGTANSRAFAVVPRGDGSLWVAGYSSTTGTNKEDFSLVRFKNNGDLDTTFGSSGGLLANLSGDTDKAYAILKQSDGKIVLVGEANTDTNGSRSRDFALVRYTVDGKLDASFSGDGKQVTAFGANDDAVARTAIQQKDGKIVVVGSSADAGGRDFAIARYLQNGALDTGFGGGDGKVLTNINGSDIATGVVQQYDGKLLVSGSSGDGGAVLVRYNTNGTLDTGFGVGGKLVTTSTSALVMNDVVQQADGQVVAAGYTFSGGKSVVAVLRYLFDDDDADGVVDDIDNCQFVANPDQLNSDDDAFGNACDDDDDNDGVKDSDDAFPTDPTETIDTDGDGIGNNADPDDDNDGVLDGDDPFPLDAFLLNRLSGDSAGDAAGYSVAIVGDVNNDGFVDTLVGAPKNDVVLPGKTKASLDVGSAYLSSGQTLEILHTFNGVAAGDAFGSTVAAVGDVNNDGTPDFAIAAPKADVSAVSLRSPSSVEDSDADMGSALLKDAGSVTVYSGANYLPLFTLTGEAAGDGFGIAVAAAGDVNADSHGDIVVGAWKADGLDGVTLKPVKDAGAAYLYSGQAAINNAQIVAQLHKFMGEAKGDYFGYSVAGGSDLDHDAVGEVSIGAYRHDPRDVLTNKLRTDAGSVYVYSNVPPYTLVKKLDGTSKGDNFGFAQAAINNGQDTFVDLLVGSPKADPVASGKKRVDAGQVALYTDNTGTATYVAYASTPQAGARFGSAVAVAGDVDAAHGVDFVVGAPGADVLTTEGKKLVNAGQASAHRADNGGAVFTYDGRYKAGQTGFSVSGGGDHNGDGSDDLLLGSPYAAFGAKAKAGVSEVISGKKASEIAVP